MSAVLAVLQSALIYGPFVGLCALSSGITFRAVGYPDLTVDGSYALGAAVAAVLILAGCDPFLATVLAGCSGFLAGAITGALVAYGGLGILAGIVVSSSIYTANLRIMGRPNIGLLSSDTVPSIFSVVGADSGWTASLVAGLVLLLTVAAAAILLRTRLGLLLTCLGAHSPH